VAQNRPKKPQKPLGFSKTVVTEFLAPEASPEPGLRARKGHVGGRPSRRISALAVSAEEDLAPLVALRPAGGRAGRGPATAGLVREWLTELKVMGRSEQTLRWYRQKMDWYLDHEDGPPTLDGLTSAELKRLLGVLIERGLKPNTVHGFFEVVRAFANWCLSEAWPSTRH
jgi:hypothetical protein